MRVLVFVSRLSQMLILGLILILVPAIAPGFSVQILVPFVLLALAFGYEVWKQDLLFARAKKRAMRDLGDDSGDLSEYRDTGFSRWLQDSTLGVMPTLVLCGATVCLALGAMRRIASDLWILDAGVLVAMIVCAMLETFSSIVFRFNTDYTGR